MKFPEVLIQIIAAIATIIIPVVVSKIYSEPIEDWFMKIIGATPFERSSIKGLWIGTLKYGKIAQNPDETYLLKIRQLGKSVTIKAVATNSDIVRGLTFRGRINSNKVITGTWKSKLVDYRNYEGAFQGIVSLSNNTVNGKFIGYSYKVSVYTGEFQITLCSHSLAVDEITQFTNKFNLLTI